MPNFCDDGYAGLEVIHVLKLKARKFDHIDVVVLAGHLQGHALADVAGESDVEPGSLEYMVGQQGSGGLAVAACDAYHSGIGVSPRELYLGDDGSAFFGEFSDQRCVGRYAGTLHHEIGVEKFLLGVSSLFIGDALFLESLAVVCME